MMNREVRRIMTTNPAVAFLHQTLDTITDVMISHNVQQLPVISNTGKLLGMIQYDQLLTLREAGADFSTLLAADAMSTKILKIAPKDKVGTAAELLADKRFRMLPVVNLRNELKGVITAFNLIKVAFNAEYKKPILYTEVFS